MTITLHTLPDATAQQVFDHVATHLLTQNERSMSVGGVCRYRHGIFRCAAGCLISDAEYDAIGPAKVENRCWQTLALERLVPSHHRELISALQSTHDNCEPEDWPDALQEVAEQFDLSTTCLEQYP